MSPTFYQDILTLSYQASAEHHQTILRIYLSSEEESGKMKLFPHSVILISTFPISEVIHLPVREYPGPYSQSMSVVSHGAYFLCHLIAVALPIPISGDHRTAPVRLLTLLFWFILNTTPSADDRYPKPEDGALA